jgi:hypothetical protein
MGSRNHTIRLPIVVAVVVLRLFASSAQLSRQKLDTARLSYGLIGAGWSASAISVLPSSRAISFSRLDLDSWCPWKPVQI